MLRLKLNWIECRSTEPKVGGSNPSRRSLQSIEDKAVIATCELSEKSEDQNLVQILFSDQQSQQIVKQWPTLSTELRRAIVRMVI